jgi:hypothetical protein
MVRRIALAISLFLLAAGPAWALTITPSGAQLTVTYKEPTTSVDGTALDDLKLTTIYYQVQGGPPIVKALEVPATRAAGGGAIEKPITIPAEPGKKIYVNIWATATDLSGNESDKSNIVTQRVDLLAPSPPE